MVDRHFSLEHTEKLRHIFTRLSDFIAENKLEQIVGVGPSASPYVRALARAHKNRHGVELKVIALGPLGEKLSWTKPGAEEDVKRALSATRKFDFSKPSLLLDEVVQIAVRFGNLSRILNSLNFPHKNAALLSYTKLRAHPGFPRSFHLHFVGEEFGKGSDFDNAVYLERGAAFGLSLGDRKLKRPDKSWLDKMKRVRKELREIADSVSPVNK